MVVLAQLAGAAHNGGGLAELDPGAPRLEAGGIGHAGHGLYLRDAAVGDELRVLRRLSGGADFAGHQAVGGDDGDGLGNVVEPLEPVLDIFRGLQLVLDAVRPGDKAGVVHQLRPVQNVPAQGGPVLVGEGGQHDKLAVFPLKDAVGGQAEVVAALALGVPAQHQGVVQIQVHAGHAVQHGHVHVLALAGPGLVVERGGNGAEGILAGHHVGQHDAALGGRAVGLAGEVHDAAAGLYQNIEPGSHGVGPILAEGGDGAVDHPRGEFCHLVIVEAKLFHHAGAEVFHHHVGGFDELLHSGDALRVLHVDGDAFLSPVVPEIGQRLPVQPGIECAGGLAGDGRLNFDDLRAQVGQGGRAGRTGHVGGKVNDFHAFKYCGHNAVLPSEM